ncbi:YuzF family protein [Bacillus sp. FJAT-45350]|uniref:YuzF family protein n=1 Tax=Bacillus sp. FJAT-45350 TaxID=2011014 RepID=UPI000BB8F21F|nr:YuzF family protein [Bacillus sp. FJAT-45350]
MSYHQHQQSQPMVPQMFTMIDPYVYQTLQSVMGQDAVIETGRGGIRGKIMDVKPDHVVLQTNTATYYIRIQEIIWVMQ